MHGAIGSRRLGLVGARSIVREVDIGGIGYSTLLVVSFMPCVVGRVTISKSVQSHL